MRNILLKSILILFATASFISCQKEEAIQQTPEQINFPNVETALQPFFEEFEYQGALRGLDIDLTTANIIGKIEDLGEEHVAGQCFYGSAIDNEITIDQGFWNEFQSYLVREMVIFHELGHCYLEQGHREGSHSNGTCISIMRSGLENCRDNYTSQTRERYLDELFSEM